MLSANLLIAVFLFKIRQSDGTLRNLYKYFQRTISNEIFLSLPPHKGPHAPWCIFQAYSMYKYVYNLWDLSTLRSTVFFLLFFWE